MTMYMYEHGKTWGTFLYLIPLWDMWEGSCWVKTRPRAYWNGRGSVGKGISASGVVGVPGT
jgi:hypothetical protein